MVRRDDYGSSSRMSSDDYTFYLFWGCPPDVRPVLACVVLDMLHTANCRSSSLLEQRTMIDTSLSQVRLWTTPAVRRFVAQRKAKAPSGEGERREPLENVAEEESEHKEASTGIGRRRGDMGIIMPCGKWAIIMNLFHADPRKREGKPGTHRTTSDDRLRKEERSCDYNELIITLGGVLHRTVLF